MGGGARHFRLISFSKIRLVEMKPETVSAAFAIGHRMKLCQIRASDSSENQNLFMPKMRAAHIARPCGAFEIVEREVPQPLSPNGWRRGSDQAVTSVSFACSACARCSAGSTSGTCLTRACADRCSSWRAMGFQDSTHLAIARQLTARFSSGSFPFLIGERIKNGGAKCALQKTPLHGCKMDVRSTTLSPNSLAGLERAFPFFDECALLLAGELDHSPTLIRVAQRCENPPFDSKIRMTHVRRLDCSRKPKRHLSEFI